MIAYRTNVGSKVRDPRFHRRWLCYQICSFKSPIARGIFSKPTEGSPLRYITITLLNQKDKIFVLMQRYPVIIGWKLMLHIVYEEGMFHAKDRGHLITVISSLWIRPLLVLCRTGMRYCEIRKEMSSLFCILNLLYFAYLRLEFQTMIRIRCPPTAVDCTVYIVHCILGQILELYSSFQLAEYIKPKIQRQHLFADLTIPHVWCRISTWQLGVAY